VNPPRLPFLKCTVVDPSLDCFREVGMIRDSRDIHIDEDGFITLDLVLGSGRLVTGLKPYQVIVEEMK
jgi:hypothetical protein